jgi:hypothetical protein
MNGFSGLPTVAGHAKISQTTVDQAIPHQLAPVPIPNLNAREFTAEEETDISANLKKGLGPEYIANRQGPGGTKVSYLEGWKSLAIANEV